MQVRKLDRPVQALSVEKLSHEGRSRILVGRITALVVKGHLDLQPGWCVLFDAERAPWTVLANVESIGHSHLCTVSAQDLAAAGYASLPELVQALSSPYGPSIDDATIVTVISWKQLRGFFADNDDEYAIEPESVYETISCA